MPDDEQPRLPLDLPEPVRRPRRPRQRRFKVPRSEAERTLMPVPIIQRCGLCGRRQTVLGDAAVCRHCGGLILRDDELDE